MPSIRNLLSRHPSAKTIKQSREQEPSVLEIDDKDADDVFSALSSETAREVLTSLYRQPQTASEVAASVDTSLQNVSYHLANLQEAGLIKIVETWYSDQGKEMNVYVSSNELLVLYAGDGVHPTSLSTVMKQLAGFTGVFALLGVLVQYLAQQVASSSNPIHTGTGGSVSDSLFMLPPGLLFFLGSLLALIAIFGWWYYRSG